MSHNRMTELGKPGDLLMIVCITRGMTSNHIANQTSLARMGNQVHLLFTHSVVPIPGIIIKKSYVRLWGCR